MDMLGQIGALASIGSLLLSRPAKLVRGATAHDVRVMTKKASLPYRATETGKSFDAQFRLDNSTTPVAPQQNDMLEFEGNEWIVWRMTPSAAGSHWVLDCLSPPTVAVVPLFLTNQDDGMGGNVHHWTEQHDAMFYAKVREASVNSQLTAANETIMGRLSMKYRASDAPPTIDTSWRVKLSTEEEAYEVMSITVDDENPAWKNAVLAREVSS